MKIRSAFVFVLIVLAACSAPLPADTPQANSPTAPADAPTAPTSVPTNEAGPFLLASAAFAQGEAIPARYSCDGENVSPSLAWTDPPAGTKSFALIMDDPDAPLDTWTHWVIYNIPTAALGLPESIPAGDQLPDGSLHGMNSWKETGYGGPCPPSGTHRYFFKLYALDTVLDLEAGVTAQELIRAMEGHLLGQTELMGVYSK